MATAQARRMPAKSSFEEPRADGFYGLPGVVTGLALGVVFIALAKGLSFGSVEDVAAMGLVVAVLTLVCGGAAHFLGGALLRNEGPESQSKIFDGNSFKANVLHCAIWVLLFAAGSGAIVSLNPEQVSLIKERVATFQKVKPMEPTPMPIPSNPGSGRSRSVFENANKDEDPNRIKSSPSRYDRSAKGPAQAFYAEQQKKRDAQIVDSLKEAGFKVDGPVEYQDPKRP